MEIDLLPWQMRGLHRAPISHFRFPERPHFQRESRGQSTLLGASIGICAAWSQRRQLHKAACAGRFPLHGGWLNDLKENGVVVIKDVFSKEEVQELKDLLWQWLEGFGGGGPGRISREDPTTWTMADQRWPQDNRSTGIVCVRGAGQTRAAWTVRGHPVVQSIFATLWDVEAGDLLTSMDGLILWRPWQQKPKEVLETWKTRGSWLHVDQNVSKRKELLAVQGFVNLCVADRSTGGFVYIPGSHVPAFQEQICESLGGAQRLRKQGDFLALEGDIWQKQAVGISLYPGDILLWDGRLVHGSEPAPGLEGSGQSAFPTELLRMAIPVCMVPRSFAQNQDELAAWRAKAVSSGMTTKHWPQRQRTQGEAAGPGFVPPELSDEMLRVL